MAPWLTLPTPWLSLRGIPDSDPAAAELTKPCGDRPFWGLWQAQAALALGIAVRVAALGAKPFWRDEAWVAVLAGGPLQEVLTGARRSVPVGFVAALQALATLPFSPEVGLRLLPLAAGLATLVALPALAASLGASRHAQLAALWVAAGNPALVYYSRELKPYALDALLATWLPILLLGGAVSPEATDGSRRRLAGLLAALALAPWISFGSVFAVVGALAWAWGAATREPGRVRVGGLAVATLAYLLSFAAAWRLAVRFQAESPRVGAAWATELAAYAPLGPRAVVRAFGDYSSVIGESLSPSTAGLAIGLAAVGALAWPRKRRVDLLGLVVLTAGAAVAAAVCGLYPLAQVRFVLFGLPGFLLLAAGGIVAVGESVGRVVAALRIRLVLVPAVAYGVGWAATAIVHRYASEPKTRHFVFDVIQEVEPLIGAAEVLRAPGQRVMVAKYAGEPFRFYARGRLADALVCTRLECNFEGPVFRSWLRSLPGAGGLLLLVEEEDHPMRRRILTDEGFAWREVARTRGGRLWEVRHREA